MKRQSNSSYILALIIIIAGILRLYRLPSYPSLNPDEAALGYNAYSLLQTGKDEHGVAWPLHFKSFGDYKPGGYVYLAIPFIKLFGLTSTAVRLPNVLLALVGIVYFYKLILLLTSNRALASLATFLLTISPWHMHFSRGAWESSSALSIILVAVYYFYLFLTTQKEKHSLFSISLFAFSLYLYHSARLFVPLLALCLVICNLKKVWGQRQMLLIPMIVGVFCVVPVFLSFLKNGGGARFGGVGLTADSGPLWRTNELINQHPTGTTANLLFVRLRHNKYIGYTLAWFDNYFAHFEGNFLFVSGDEVPRSRSPDMGQLYLVDAFFLLLGLSFLVCSKKPPTTNHQLLATMGFWLLLAPIASSLTFQAPSALRALPMVIPLTFFTSLGVYQFLVFVWQLKFTNLKFVCYFGFVICYFVSVVFYLDSYFGHMLKRYPFAHNYGFSTLVSYTEAVKEHYDKIYVTTKYDQPYILFLFFAKYPPAKFQQEVELTPPDKFGFSTVTHFANYIFTDTDTYVQTPPNSLVIKSTDPFFQVQ